MAPKRCPVCGAPNATCVGGAPGPSVRIVSEPKKRSARNKKRTAEENK